MAQVKPGQTISRLVTTRALNGTPVNPTSISGVLYKNGVATAESVTVTNQTTGRYLVGFTTPAYDDGDQISILLLTTIAAVAYESIVFNDEVVTKRVSELHDATQLIQRGEPPTVETIQSGLALTTDVTAAQSALETAFANASPTIDTGAIADATVEAIDEKWSPGDGPWNSGSSGATRYDIPQLVNEDTGLPVADADTWVVLADAPTVIVDSTQTRSDGYCPRPFWLDAGDYILRRQKAGGGCADFEFTISD